MALPSNGNHFVLKLGFEKPKAVMTVFHKQIEDYFLFKGLDIPTDLDIVVIEMLQDET